jgi:hypothetical protein
MTDRITAREFEAKVLEKEDVVVRLRCPPNQEVNDYDYVRKVPDKSSLTEWLEQRVNPRIGEAQCDIIDGHSFQRPHGRTSMGKLRSTYER